MGIISFFSTKEYLYSYIEANNTKKAIQLLKNNPSLINQQLTTDSRCTALSRATWRNNYQLVEILLGIGADPNKYAGNTTPLMIACYRNNLQIAQLLIKFGAQVNALTQQNLNCLDYAILFGNFSIAKYLIDEVKMKNTNTFDYYRNLSLQKQMFYVNYQLFFKCLNQPIKYGILPDFYALPPKIQLNDPVLDPNEGWIPFIKRVSQFGDPPLIERSSLPLQLQPQNRILGKIHYYVQKLKGGNSRLSLEPKQQHQIQSDRNHLNNQV